MFTAVVVFPTPPFWFATAYTVAIESKIVRTSVGTAPAGLIRPRTGVSCHLAEEASGWCGAELDGWFGAELFAGQGPLARHSGPAADARRRRLMLLVDVEMPTARSGKRDDGMHPVRPHPDETRGGGTAALLGVVARSLPGNQEAALAEQRARVLDQRREGSNGPGKREPIAPRALTTRPILGSHADHAGVGQREPFDRTQHEPAFALRRLD